MTLNQLAHERLIHLQPMVTQGWITRQTVPCGAEILDFGVHLPGGLAAGIQLAEVALATLARVSIGHPPGGPRVEVITEHPLRACLGGQYAGWPIQADSYFAMGSGPMRLARGRERILEQNGLSESPARVVGVLESDALPPDDVCRSIAEECQVACDRLQLLVAPVTSAAGTIQVVSRSVETCLHKLFELEFDLRQVRWAMGSAPLPPVACDTLTGIGRTNDAILYGAEVTLWVESSDEQIERIGPLVPSSSSQAYGEPFADVFRRHDRDFYKIDPMLFSPASIRIDNLKSGTSRVFGEVRADILKQSFHSD